jgi:5'-3' exonuclease
MALIALIDGDIITYEVNWKFPNSYDLAWFNFKKRVNNIVESVFASDYLIAVSGKYNYRDTLYREYKGTRQKNESKTKFIRLLREQAVVDLGACPADGREADDLLRIWARECESGGNDYIICSGDKDLFAIPGRHYLLRSNKIKNVSVEEAERFYWEQILKGDATDNIPGLPGIGPIKASEMLLNCKTTEDYKKTVALQYIRFYGEEWHNQLLSNGKVIHIQEHVNDWFTFDKKYEEIV